MVPDAEREQILSLWRDGLSASQIRTEIGNTRSRNAIVGVVFRARQNGVQLHRTLQPAMVRKRSSRPFRAPQPQADEPEAVGPIGDFPDRKSCHYPRNKDGEPFQACGHPGYPWCAYHAAICYAPQRKSGSDQD